MIEFLKTKTGVFVTAGVVLVFALIAFFNGKKDPEEPVPVKTTVAAEQPEEEEPTVTPATALPARVAERAAGRESERRRVRSDESTDQNGVSLLRRPTAQTPGSDSSGRVRFSGYGGQTEEEGENGVPAPGQVNANGPKLAVRLAPMPRREAPAAPVASVSTPPPGYRPGLDAVPKLPIDPKRFAPFGRLIKCELVLAIDSVNDQTPVVALVVEDQWWNGELIIPAGTEVHGSARADRERDRIRTNQDWVLVMPRQGKRTNGRELYLKGIGLDRDDRTGDNLTWGITDGSYGLRGYAIRTMEKEQLLVFAANFLSSAAGALQDQTTNSFTGTTTPDASAKNAALAGTQAVMNDFANKMLNEISRNGVYIRVPAGKQWYLYVMQPIAPDIAAIGASAEPAPNPDAK